MSHRGLQLDDLEKTALSKILELKEVNVSRLSAAVGSPKANVFRRVERLEEMEILTSRYEGRQRMVSLNPASADDVRAILGIVPSKRTLILVSDRSAQKLIDYFKPDEVILLTVEGFYVNSGISLGSVKLRTMILPDSLVECYNRVQALVTEEKTKQNALVAIAITEATGIVSVAAGMVARDTHTPVLVVEGDQIRQLL
ncbi:MAG: helix-turn-helix domain-containing protein [Candidatus Bathyarchaeia archaeon]